MSMRLIGAVTSPYVRKVRVVLAEKKLDYRFVPEDVWADDTQIAAANPLGKVPCPSITRQGTLPSGLAAAIRVSSPHTSSGTKR